LRKLTKTVERIDVRRLEVTSERFKVETDLVNGGTSRLLEVGIISVKSESMTDEIASVGIEAKMLKDGSHVDLLEIHTLMSLAVGGIILSDKIEEFTSTVLLEHAHQTRAHGFTRGSRNFVDFEILRDDVATINLLKLKILGGIRENQHLDKETCRHDKLRDEINVPVTKVLELRRERFSTTILLIELLEVKRGTFSTIIVVSIQMKDLVFVNREQTRENAFLKASA
jgi:hypothetical protein